MTLLNTFANLGLVTFERTNNAHVLDSSPVQMPNLATLAPASTDERDAADEILDTSPPIALFPLASCRPGRDKFRRLSTMVEKKMLVLHYELHVVYHE